MADWFLDNIVQVTTLLTLAVLIARLSRWSGIMENRVHNLEEWKKQHIEFTHGGTP